MILRGLQTGRAISAFIQLIVSTVLDKARYIQLVHSKDAIEASGEIHSLLAICVHRDIFLASNHRNVGLTVLQTFMAGELFQGLQAMSMFTEAESRVLAMIPSIAAAAGLKNLPSQLAIKEAVSRAVRFEQESHSHKFLQMRTPSAGHQIRIPGLLSKIQSAYGIRDSEIVQSLVIAAIRTSFLQNGRIVSYSRSSLLIMVPHLFRVRLLGNKHHHYADIGENCFISYAPAGERQSRVFARLRFLCAIQSGVRKLQVLICQRAVFDEEPIHLHGLLARRLRLECFGLFQLPERYFSSIELASGIIHDCAESFSRGNPCSLVNDYPLLSYTSGRKRSMFDCNCGIVLFRIESNPGVRHSDSPIWLESPIAMCQDQD
jgi:hypothetical protein